MIRLVANAYEILIEIMMWVVLALGALQGYAVGQSVIGLVFGLLLALLFDIVVFGTLVILLEIRNDLKKLAHSRTPPAAGR
ncbi:hypothetical protein [Oceanithermus sp.]|uniref:hypothetical protein n=1 Tax=Oceanithermus sp. TaxID=2268145 RepID=UPI00257C5B46|nr:hypothetical protein [Oceanithermus sp.]